MKITSRCRRLIDMFEKVNLAVKMNAVFLETDGLKEKVV